MNMEDNFSWSDSVQAVFIFCLPCLRPRPEDDSSAIQHDNNSGTSGVRRARPNELEGLLADSGDTDTEAETMSLHSNFGAGERRRRKTRGLKKITIFGWNLFGRPPIHLPDDEADEEDALLRGRRSQSKPGTLSSSTLDSDAAPLDTAAIEHMQITSAQLDERAAAAEAESKRLKEERRQLRRERRELRKAAKALALAAEGSIGADERFPGSGSSTNRHTPSPFQNASPSPPAQSGISNGLGGIATFFKGDPSNTEPDSDEADLGGHIYARRATSGNSNGSDSRSRTSASLSNPDQSAQYNHYNSRSSPQLPHSSHSDFTPNTSQLPRKPKSSKSKSSKSGSSKGSSSTSQSPSLPSPVHTSFPTSPGVALPYSPLSLSTPLQEFEGLPTDSGELSGFPSVGFGRGRGKGRDMGAFLADRGNT